MQKRRLDHSSLRPWSVSRPPSRSGYCPGRLLLPARRLIAGGVGLGRVINFAGLHHIGLVIVLAIAIDVDLDDDLVRLAVMNIFRLEAQTVLAAQHGVDRAEHGG